MKYREEGKWVELTNENYFKLSKEQLIIALGTITMQHKKAQQRIDKAIEYINKYEYQRYCPSPYEKEKYIMREEKEGQELLSILRGEEK